MKLKNSLLLFIILFLGESCSTLSKITLLTKKKSSFSNYYQKNFECDKSPGMKDSELYEFYLKNGWEKFQSEYQNKNLEKKKAEIVIIGNSLIHLFTDEAIKREFPNKDIVGRGIFGDTTELLYERLDSNVFNLKPKTIILEIGGNDLINGKCLSIIKNNTSKIIDKIYSYNKNTKIIFLSVPPTLATELNSIVPLHNQSLMNLSKEKKFIYIDLWDEMLNLDKTQIKDEYVLIDKKTLKKDSIHFNEEGYKLIGKLVRPYLK